MDKHVFKKSQYSQYIKCNPFLHIFCDIFNCSAVCLRPPMCSACGEKKEATHSAVGHHVCKAGPRFY